MKKWIIACSLAVLFTACSKNDMQVQSEDVDSKTGVKATDNAFYVSDWEQVSQWKNMDSANFRVFYAERTTPELTGDVIANGVVITYSKIISADPDYLMFTKPIPLPFYFLPPAEKSANSFYWYDLSVPGKIKLSYRIWNNKEETPSMAAGVGLPDFQFRYFIISKAYLDSKGIDANTVKHHYTYQQLISFLGMHG